MSKEISDTKLLAMFDGMYSGDKDGSGVEQLTVKVVRTKKSHDCPGMFAGQLHTIPIGSRAIREHALVDGAWRSCWTCERCILRYAKEYGGQP